MAILGSLLKQAIALNDSMRRVRPRPSPARLQVRTLLKLLSKAQYTSFGVFYGFRKILMAPDPVQEFRRRVPIFDYNEIYNRWWHRTLEGEEDICWPGRIRYFALSSGTSESASKRIPITRDLLRSNTRTSIRQLLTLADYNLPEELFTKGILMLGGSTDLVNKGHYYEGDLSGISQAKMPGWFHPYYKPGRLIAKERDWNKKIEQVVLKAKDWDIGFIVGVPAWIQITLEKIIAHYNLRHIHELWPHLSVYVHGGVSFEPYRKSFEKLLGRPLEYIETYLASEGFIAYQSRRLAKGMTLVLDNGIFLEFIPFNSRNFDDEGQLKSGAESLWINDVKEGEEYALLLSTNAGAWRYLIGDTIRFVDLERCEIVITGRTKHFLSLCGEHLSVDNMNAAIRLIDEEFHLNIREFTVAGISEGSLFAHKWYIGAEKRADVERVRQALDTHLCRLNDDYAVERQHALRNVYVELLPPHVFYSWMEKQGKIGSQNKFPRVLKGQRLEDWEQFVQAKKSLMAT
ncbi:MAG: GH3 auxin-responsive promoter family protein [Flavobacteriales bacterium]|nr:GH3 auxin-responsive promoter family protein [Flavobacteriales bacterium]MCX7768112.1 GH3 auxin-responsive promoter family protein [Flavobacteriales bacterium]MDW8409596.1 GH3 auxin-responsive promoter family protein [Flavobacteriales bacterium]